MSILGQGIYTMADASRYLRMSPNTVRSWFNSSKSGVFTPSYRKSEKDVAISFLDLVDAMVAGDFRKAGVSMKCVRESYNRLRDQFETEHPFCHQKLYTDGKSIYYQMGDDIAHAMTDQGHWYDMLREHLKLVEYSDDTQLAARWRPEDNILIDPNLSFGKPVVASAFVPTLAIYKAYLANGRDEAFTAELFEVEQAHVHAAVTFEESFKTAA